MEPTQFDTLQQWLNHNWKQYAATTAIEYGPEHLSYEQLGSLSNQLAGAFWDQGIKEGSLVAVFASSKTEVILSILASLSTGAVFMPLDPKLPAARIGQMLAAAKPDFVLLGKGVEQEAEAAGLSASAFQVLGIEALLSEKKAFDSDYVPAKDAPAYIYFTSGSTGVPKAILGQQKGIFHFISWEVETFALQPGLRSSQFIHIGFDAFLRDLFVPLCAGGTCVIPADNQPLMEEQQLVTWLEDNKIELIHTVPSFFRLLNHERISAESYPALRYVFLSGEKIVPASLQRWYDIIGDRVQLVNLYGATETTMTKTFHLISAADCALEHMPVGKAMKGCRVYILDDTLKPQPKGAFGEVYIRTPFRTLGYYQQPEMTAERFIPNPSTKDPRDLFYKTGDVGRILSDDSLEIVGRKDRQVKVRGVRIELDEIEASLQLVDGVDQAAVIAVEKDNEQLLAAYYSTNGNTEQQAVREGLAAALPEYMMPSWVIALDEIPLLPNGKIDRKGLPDPDSVLQSGVDVELNETENKIREIWASLLGKPVEDVNPLASFFDQGGHSLKAIMMVSRIHKAIDVLLPIKDIFASPTIKGIAAMIDKAGKDVFKGLTKAPVQDSYPLSSAQRRLYFLNQLEPGTIVYNIPVITKIKGKVDTGKLEQAFTQLLERHQILRTKFTEQPDGPVQQVVESPDFAIEQFSGLSPEGAIKAFIRPFDLATAPLFRAGLLSVTAEEHYLLTDMHHIIGDGVSTQLLISDFASFYQGETLEALKLQYIDYAAFVESEASQKAIAAQADFWKQRFDEIPLLDLPTDRPRKVVASQEGDSLFFDINKEHFASLRALCKEEGVTLFMGLQAVMHLWLNKLTRQQDIVIGTPVAGRNHPDLEPMVGMFVNMLALRTISTPEDSFRKLLKQVKKESLEAFDHQDYLYEDLVDAVVTERNTSRNPLFDAVLVLQNMQAAAANLSGLEIEEYIYERGIAKFDITLTFQEIGDQLKGRVEFRKQLFEKATIQLWLDGFAKIITQVCAQPDQSLKSYSLLSEAEMGQYWQDAAQATDRYPREATIVSLFDGIVKSHPQQIAVTAHDGQLSYAELNAAADNIAANLLATGVKAQDIVALHLHRTVWMPAAIMGVLKAGAAYLPLEPSLPAERKQFMLEDSGAVLLLQDSDAALQADKVLNMEAAKQATDSVQQSPAPDHLAYIIYTSGTTGKPKGVMIEHRQVVQLLFNEQFQFNFGTDDVWTLFHSYSFDFSIWEIFGALLYGGRLVIVSKEETLDPARFVQTLASEKVTVLNQTPSAFYNLSGVVQDMAQKPALAIREIIFGGEALQPSLLSTWKGLYPGSHFVNMYGITETCVHVTYKEIGEAEIAIASSNIGNALPTTSCYLLDSLLRPVLRGVTAELWVGGEGLSRGYLNRPELTSERFIIHPATGKRLYKSGDLARVMTTGELEYIGRIDHQVQLRGFRIELGEIETALLRVPHIDRAVVLARKDQLQAFVTGDRVLDVPEVRSTLQKALPEYMVPGTITQLEKIPLTINGKVDQKELLKHTPVSMMKVGADALTGQEQALAAIWSRLLKIDIEQVSAESNFFEMGGHSLKVTALATSIKHELGFEVSILNLFRNPVLADQARLFASAEKVESADISPAPQAQDYPVSPAQRRLYIAQISEPETTRYNVPAVLPLPQGTSIDALRSALSTLTERHEVLRTHFAEIEGEVRQVIIQSPELSIASLESNETLNESGLQSFSKTFDLHQGPLWRATQITQGEKCILLLDMHHIITDAISQQILATELYALLEEKTLAPLQLQYKDYAHWLVQPAQQKTLQSQATYWKSHLSKQTGSINLPLDHIRPAQWDARGTLVKLTFTQEETGQIREAAAKAGVTVYTYLLSAFALLQSRFANQEQFITGTSVSGRNQVATQSMIGKFVNLLPIQIDAAPSFTYADFAQSLANTVSGALDNQDYPFESIVADLGISRQRNRHMLFDTCFTMISDAIAGQEQETASEVLVSEQVQAKFDLFLMAIDQGDQLSIGMTFAKSLFNTETVKMLMTWMRHLLLKGLTDPHCQLSDIKLTDQEDDKHITSTDLNVSDFDF